MSIRQTRRASIYQNKRVEQRMERSLQQHKRIYEAIKKGDAEMAEKEMEEHLKDVISTTKEMMIDNFFIYR